MTPYHTWWKGTRVRWTGDADLSGTVEKMSAPGDTSVLIRWDGADSLQLVSRSLLAVTE